MACLFVLLTDKGNFVCGNPASNNGFCLIHQKDIDQKLYHYCTDLYQNFFKDNQLDTFNSCLQLPMIIPEYLNRLFLGLMKRTDVRGEIMIKLINHKKFYPDLFDYSIFFQHRVDYLQFHIQTAFSAYFYKRWLIKLALQSINIELEDCVNLITNPYQSILPTPYYYSKYLLYPALYPTANFHCDRIIQIISDQDIILDVEETDIEDTIYLFNKMYLIDIVNYCYIGKRVDDKILDLNDNDIEYLKQHNRGIMRIIDNDSYDDRYENFEYHEVESKVKDFNPEGYLLK